jgi:NADPH:quinone reductase-like Zn-dependent oxidoreductase
MKVVRLLEYGGQLVFEDLPTPTIARDEILAKVKSTTVNHVDLVKASGTVRQILPIELPWIPGHEFSGVVEQIGSDVAAYAPGDAVFGATSGMGAYAEYLAVKAAVIAKKPSNLSFEEAASVPVAAQTAWQGIFTHGHLEKGQTILIHGGAPGCGRVMEGYRRKPARGSWDVVQWAGSGKTQVTRQDRASCGLRNPKGRLRIANYERNSF